jgi:hypothetical protein
VTTTVLTNANVITGDVAGECGAYRADRAAGQLFAPGFGHGDGDDERCRRAVPVVAGAGCPGAGLGEPHMGEVSGAFDGVRWGVRLDEERGYDVPRDRLLLRLVQRSSG